MKNRMEMPYANAYSSQFYEVVHYASETPYVTTFDFFGLNLNLYNGMSDAQKKVIEDSLSDVCKFSFGIFKDMQEESMKKLAENGMEFYTPDIKQFRDCMPRYYELCKWTKDFKSNVENEMKAYRSSK